ncbi:DUF4238 domain-containing protein [Tsukamurella sp. M9C]|uniref:DUF4238 domain-containing protein n=1 Tax=unclassified Tsukamurella TaxID=2633480 RepID=UPI001CCCEBB0|nr:DUF4238 domain-containing protein [Tsukamurella sp. M9C]MCA0158475.1 DUF4238 domain-containing protein [Tsukamurella sp. M9C]
MAGRVFAHRWTTDAEIEESKRQASAGGVGKRHHHVPQVYLRRWADDAGALRVTKVATRDSYVQPTKDIAKKTNLYTISADDLAPDYPALWFEKHMSRIESEAAGWIGYLDSLPDGQIVDVELIANLAVFVGLQEQRTLKKRAQELRIEDALNHFGRAEVVAANLPTLCAISGTPYSPDRHDELVQQLLDVPLLSTERKPRALESAIGVWRHSAVPHLAIARSWWLVSTRAPLITCDEPVVWLGGPARGRWEPAAWAKSSHGIYPVGPSRLLVLVSERFHPLPPSFVLSAEETSKVNFEIVAASHEFCYENPLTSIAAAFDVPPWPRFEPARASTFMEAVAEPSRWTIGEGPPWAVGRWYP